MNRLLFPVAYVSVNRGFSRLSGMLKSWVGHRVTLARVGHFN
ncbi:hypothetical protein [Advenella kashmirensis]|nr:hypothetical protein [Advenella kashmirensis]